MSVTLKKGQRLNLSKLELSKVVMGLGWDPAKKGQKIDLDASAILFDADGKTVSKVWFSNKKSPCGSVYHSGDNLTGAGEGDDEKITVELSRVPVNVKSIVFVITSYSGQTFSQIANAFCRLVNVETGKEEAKYELDQKYSSTGMIMVSVYRKDNGWSIRAIGEEVNGTTVNDVVDKAASFV